MKIAQKESAQPTADPRTIPLPLQLDDDGTARWVQSARSTEDAWSYLGLPPPVDVTNELAAAATRLCTVGDSIGKALLAFGQLDPDAPVPPGWVDRVVAIHLELLDGYWALDDLAWKGLKEGGWTVSTTEPLAEDVPGRIAQRARWVAEESRPKAPALWHDRLDRQLRWAEKGAREIGAVDAVQETGRVLVAAVVRHRFEGWQRNRTETR